MREAKEELALRDLQVKTHSGKVWHLQPNEEKKTLCGAKLYRYTYRLDEGSEGPTCPHCLSKLEEEV